MQRILIANRGEIAVRIARACADAGYVSIAVYADQDFDAMHVRVADEAYALGGATPGESYLNIDRLLEIAQIANADAVHPGYGFLSENANFARAVEAAGLTFIGPTPESIEQLGDKVTARQIASSVGAPLVPGTDRPLADAQEAIAFATEFGLPVAIKAAFGGGGRGLKVVRRLDEVAAAFDSATREAVTAFGRGECYVERFLDKPRHVEVQVVGDGQGEVLVVGDRDCSLQRRNQKLVEEAPAPNLSDEVRERIHTAAKKICAAVNYRGAGTVEFLLAEDGTVSFLEVNTRLQVEHPITETTSGVDLVREQFRVAEGQGLSRTQTPVAVGHAFEFRINAEDPGRGFLPSPGTVEELRVPGGPGVRWDAGVETGDRVEGAFDSMLGKLVVTGENREVALARSRRALRELEVSGFATVLPFHRAVLDHADFIADQPRVYTQWIETELMPKLEPGERAKPSTSDALLRLPIELDGRRVQLGLPAELLSRFSVAAAAPGTVDPRDAAETSADGAADTAADTVLSPISGTLVHRLMADGAEVAEGDAIAVCEAMKMEMPVQADRTGIITWLVDEGAPIRVDAPLARITPAAD
ncbi:acetyl/propionyl/methylcrotonyl-CoA carboxylase subunit alpha [Gulosibacter chungangensis]|uniref:biotin carboxylase n=1 Tax=Gulosibacter chungangensis TaxID=979746 RepID=A0A7J5BEN2_9MICO|nr:biotin carboxylase N-terminal domain-containing protein [Gulosibacter chungangensis]KAB1644716.1 ATP-grasp domain-containing protein [Gulosibacter chungangensis]